MKGHKKSPVQRSRPNRAPDKSHHKILCPCSL
nr:MAG TPA: hypothetical protein [Caudoviricetes sp.]